MDGSTAREQASPVPPFPAHFPSPFFPLSKVWLSSSPLCCSFSSVGLFLFFTTGVLVCCNGVHGLDECCWLSLAALPLCAASTVASPLPLSSFCLLLNLRLVLCLTCFRSLLLLSTSGNLLLFCLSMKMWLLFFFFLTEKDLS